MKVVASLLFSAINGDWRETMFTNESLFDDFRRSYRSGNRNPWRRVAWEARPNSKPAQPHNIVPLREPAEQITEQDVSDELVAENLLWTHCGECRQEDYAMNLVAQHYPHEGEYLCGGCNRAYIEAWEDQREAERYAV